MIKFKPILNERLKKLIGMLKDSWGRMVIASLCLLVVAGTQGLMAYMVKPVLDNVFVKKQTEMLWLLPIAVLAMFLIKGLADYFQQYLMGFVGHHLIRRLRNLLYDRIQSLPLAFFHKEKTGVLMSRISNDVNMVRETVNMAITGAAKDLFSIVGLTVVIFYQIPKLAIFAFFVLPVAFYPIVLFGRKVRRYSTGVQETMAEMNSFLHETFFGNKIVKAFCMEEKEKKRFRKFSGDICRLDLKELRVRSLSSPLMEFLGGVGIAFIIGYGGAQVIEGVYTAGTFMSFITAVFMLYAPVKKLSKFNNRFQKGLAAVDRVFDILEQESDVRESQSPVAISGDTHRVAFEDVFFKYDDTMVLKGIDLDVQPGEILALVGMSGGGKTSLVNLIPRFYDVVKGAVKIDGVDIRDIGIAVLRNQIAIVTQEPILFNESVRNNIAYGRPDASEEDIFQAARAAYAYDFIDRFPKKFDTSIGELGGRLSGGEKQRICIARALLKNAPILILDEATSSLDSEAEKLVQKALENLMRGRTTFVIAHRLSTIGYAHRIAVIIDGRISELGDHDALMSLQGEFYKLYTGQFSADSPAGDDSPDRDKAPRVSSERTP